MSFCMPLWHQHCRLWRTSVWSQSHRKLLRVGDRLRSVVDVWVQRTTDLLVGMVWIGEAVDGVKDADRVFVISTCLRPKTITGEGIGPFADELVILFSRRRTRSPVTVVGLSGASVGRLQSRIECKSWIKKPLSIKGHIWTVLGTFDGLTLHLLER